MLENLQDKLGFIFKKISHKFSDIVLSFAAGVMLAAAVLGLILPSLEYGGKWGILGTIGGIFGLRDGSRSAILRVVGGAFGSVVGALGQGSGVALVIAGLAAHGTTTIENAEYINRGHQDIVKDLRQLGANIVALDQ